MNIGLINSKGFNDIEHWFKLEYDELIRRGHNVRVFSLKHKHPTKEDVKWIDFGIIHFAQVALYFRRFGFPFCIIPSTNDIFPDNGKTLNIASSHKNCKFVTYQSFYHKRYYKIWNTPKPKVYYPHPVRTELFKRESSLVSSMKEIIAGGRLVPRKGLDRVIPLVDNLTVFGDGPFPEYTKYLKSLNSTTNWVGHLNGEELKELMEHSWLYLFPSVIVEDGNRDGIANTLKEAMLMRLQVIASPVVGTPELENICLFDDWDNIKKCIDNLSRKPNWKGEQEIRKLYAPKVTVGMLLEGIEEHI